MQAWVREELAWADLGDARLNARMMRLVDHLSRDPEASFNAACPRNADRVAAYRFCANETVTPEVILQPHIEKTWRRCQGLARVLVVQDTTEFNFSSRQAVQGLGPVALGQGFFAHSALALSEEGEPVGLVHQEVWARDPEAVGRCAARRRRPWSEKESYKWQRTLEAIQAARPSSQELIVIGDRESDIYGLLASPRPAGLELLVRSAQNRKLQGEEGYLREALLQGPAAGQVRVEVRRTPDREPRVALCEVRFRPVTLAPPRHGDKEVPRLPVTVWVVRINELHPPKGETPLQWVLLATWRIETLAAALQAVAYYSRRWLVERFHYVLKSGCHMEASQLRRRARLERLEAIYAIISWHILALTYQARLRPDQPCTLALSHREWQVLYAHRHQHLPAPGEPVPTLREALLWIAQLGGYWARKHDAPPGVKVIWRGFRRLQELVAGFTLAVSILEPEQDVCNA